MADQYLLPFPLITATQDLLLDTWIADDRRYPFQPSAEVKAGDQVFGTSDGRLLGFYRGGQLRATYRYDSEREALVLDDPDED